MIDNQDLERNQCMRDTIDTLTFGTAARLIRDRVGIDACTRMITNGKIVNPSVALDMSVKALEKQIPMKPKGIDGCRCPKCDTQNLVWDGRKNTVGKDIVFCWHCGQAVEL